VQGTIVQIRLENPHSWFFIDVKDASGKVERWAFEAGTPSGMVRNGFKPNIIKKGVEVTIKGFHAKDPSRTRACCASSFSPTALVRHVRIATGSRCAVATNRGVDHEASHRSSRDGRLRGRARVVGADRRQRCGAAAD
jgi:hypothetical protein